jgi:uncharacterized protein
MDAWSILQKHLGSNPSLFEVVSLHSQMVVTKALAICENHPELPLNKLFIEEAGLVHDIGVYLTDAPEIHCHGAFPYICHGYLGREIMEAEGYPIHALACERHTGTGLYLSEIQDKKLPLPQRNLAPVSLEEQVLCFADKFFSKSDPRRTFATDEIRVKLMRYGSEGVDRFDKWCRMFL